MKNQPLLYSLKLYLTHSIKQAEDLLHEGAFQESGKYSEENIKGTLVTLEEILYLIKFYGKQDDKVPWWI